MEQKSQKMAEKEIKQKQIDKSNEEKKSKAYLARHKTRKSWFCMYVHKYYSIWKQKLYLWSNLFLVIFPELPRSWQVCRNAKLQNLFINRVGNFPDRQTDKTHYYTIELGNKELFGCSLMPKVPYGKLVTGNGSLIPICSLSNRFLLPNLTVHKILKPKMS